MYVYRTDGEAVGFVYESFVYDLAGIPLGRILGSRVHRLDGTYVGEWFKEMVVERPAARPRDIPAVATPPLPASPGTTSRRRVVVDYGYRDCFDRLYEAADGYSQAAE
jgi:hypothetical protein